MYSRENPAKPDRELCGAQRKGEPEPCTNAASECRVHCGGITRAGHPCPNRPITDRARCRKHRGKAKRGIEHYNFKTGSRIKFLPDRYVEKYAELESDSTWIELRDEITATDMRLAELYESVDVGGSTASTVNVYKSWSKLERALKNGDERLSEYLDEHADAVKAMHSKRGVWAEIMQQQDHRRKLVESERKRLTEAAGVMTAQDAALFKAVVLNSIRSRVDDPRLLADIAGDIRAASSRTAS